MTHPVGFSQSSPSVAAVVGSLDKSLSCFGAHIMPQAHRVEILGVRLSEPCIAAARSPPYLVAHCSNQSVPAPLHNGHGSHDLTSSTCASLLSKTFSHFSCFIGSLFCRGCAGLEGGYNQAAERVLEEEQWSQAKTHHHVQACHHKLQWKDCAWIFLLNLHAMLCS